MNHYSVVNYHVTNRCNFHCSYCFAKFKEPEASLTDAKTVVDNIASYFRKCGLDGRINFAGGEPLLYRHLDELIDYTHSVGVSVSVISNGFLLTEERIERWKGKVSCIGISVDSLRDNTNRSIGRCCEEKTLDLKRLVSLSQKIRECSIELKVNTVVSKRNLDEDLTALYLSLKPDRIKFLQMHLIRGVNDKAESDRITEEEFKAFCSRYQSLSSKRVCESEGSMENSYLMVNPAGEFQLNNDGRYETFGSLKTTPFSEILKNAPMDSDKFNSRYTGGRVR